MSSQNFTAGARIVQPTVQSFEAKARIELATPQNITIRARIYALHRSTSLTCVFNIRKAQTQTVIYQYWTNNGRLTQQTLTVKARIVQRGESILNGTFVINAPDQGLSLSSLSSIRRGFYTMSIKARIIQ